MFDGTGSNPHSHRGLHFNTLFIASIDPEITPNSFIAKMAYVEHVGINLHCLLKSGEINILYKYITPSSSSTKGIDKILIIVRIN